MGRPINPAYQKRDALIVVRYQNNEGLRTLSTETGLSRLRIRRILEKAGLTIRPEPRATRLQNNFRNNHLVAIGARLFLEQHQRRWSLPEMAIALGLSEPHLGEALQGLYNWRFVELVRAAEVLGIALDEFLRIPLGMRQTPLPTENSHAQPI